MATKIEEGKTVTRETGVLERGRPLLVTLHETYMELRLKGRREAVRLDYEVALAAARKVAARDAGIKI